MNLFFYIFYCHFLSSASSAFVLFLGSAAYCIITSYFCCVVFLLHGVNCELCELYWCRMYVESDDFQTKKLYITSIQSGDKGTFTCTAHRPDTQLRKSVQLFLFSECCQVFAEPLCNHMMKDLKLCLRNSAASG